MDPVQRKQIMNNIEALAEQDTTAGDTPSEAVEEKQDVVCPCCSYNVTNPEKSELNEEDKEEFLRSILGSRAFTKTYEYYGGNVKLTFSSLLNEEIDLLNKKTFKLTPDSESRMVEMSIKIKLLFMLRKIETSTGTDEDFIAPTDIDWDLDEEFTRRFKGKPDAVLQFMSTGLTVFQGLNETLINGGIDENFWKGAGPV